MLLSGPRVRSNPNPYPPKPGKNRLHPPPHIAWYSQKGIPRKIESWWMKCVYIFLVYQAICGGWCKRFWRTLGGCNGFERTRGPISKISDALYIPKKVFFWTRGPKLSVHRRQGCFLRESIHRHTIRFPSLISGLGEGIWDFLIFSFPFRLKDSIFWKVCRKSLINYREVISQILALEKQTINSFS